MTGGVAARDEKPDRSSTQHLLRWLLLDDAQEPRPGVLLLDDGGSDEGSRTPADTGSRPLRQSRRAETETPVTGRVIGRLGGDVRPVRLVPGLATGWL
jgi:hypothetical protein